MSSNGETHERNKSKDEGGETSESVANKKMFDDAAKAFRLDIFNVLAKHEPILGQALLPMANDIVETIKLAGMIEKLMPNKKEEK